MTLVLLATCRELPQGEPGGEHLIEAFTAAGADVRWVAWDDPDVDWAAADVVAARSTWDYEHRREEFLAWARSVDPRLLNGSGLFAWNTDKRYLLELAHAGLAVVPTIVAESEDELPAAIATYERAVVKPTVGAGGRGVTVFDGTDVGPSGPAESGLPPGPWIVQPLVESVRTEGEHSVFVLGGEPVAQLTKQPAGGEIRVHETYGGRSDVVELDPEAADLARRTVAAAERLLGVQIAYARVDQLRMPDGSLAVGELEATEPGLYLEELPGNASHFVAAALATREG